MASVQLASAYLAGVPNASLAQVSLDAIADAVDACVAPSTADVFHGAYLTFQEALTRGDEAGALKIAHEDLSRLVGKMDSVWRKVRRTAGDYIYDKSDHLAWGRSEDPFVNSQNHKRLANAEEVYGSESGTRRPVIIVEADSPADRVLCRRVARAVMKLLLVASLDKTGDGAGKWNTRIASLGLLDSQAVRFKFSRSMEKKGAVFSALYGRTDDGMPSVEAAFSEEKYVNAFCLSAALLTSIGGDVKPLRVHLSEADFEDGGRNRFRNLIGFLGRAGEPEKRQKFVNELIPVAMKLLWGDYSKEMSLALERIGVRRDDIPSVLESMKGYNIRVTARQLCEGAMTPPSIEVVRPSKSGRNALRIDISLPEPALLGMDAEGFWRAVARGVVRWRSRGSAESASILYQLRLDDDWETARFGAFHADSDWPLIPEELPRPWGMEFHSLIRFVSRISSGKGLNGLGLERAQTATTAIGGGRLAKWRDIFMAPSGVVMRHADGILPLTRRDTHDTAEPTAVSVNIWGDLNMLAKEHTPLQAVELLLRREGHNRITTEADRRSAIKFYRDGEPLSLNSTRLQSQTAWNEEWAWVRLVWQYQMLKNGGGVLDITGGLSSELKQQIARLTLTLSMENPAAFAESVRIHPGWVFESARIISSRAGVKEVERVTVAALRGAKLIHFDGEPNFTGDEWRRVVRIVAMAPDGLTWVEPRRDWRTNRPDVVAGEGDPEWFAQNPSFRKLFDEKKRHEYIIAMMLVRGLMRKYRVDLPLPEPRSAAADIKPLARQLSLTFHEDRRGNADFIDIGDDMRGKFFAALEVLKEFHSQLAP